MHLLADIGDVGENGFLVSFSEKLGWGNRVSFFGGAGKKRWIGSVQGGVEPCQ
jgi:hypothetical protein